MKNIDESSDSMGVTPDDFPHFLMLKASAGSGKTRELTKRYVQFLLSDRIPGNSLRNLLAITFSNNAAREMKERVLQWLKDIYFMNEEVISEFHELLGTEKKALVVKAEKLIEEILKNYSNFQIRTIDSFMTTILRASAQDFGYNPEFEILMNREALLRKAFDIFLKNITENSTLAGIFLEIVDDLERSRGGESGFLWDPANDIFIFINNIYSAVSVTPKGINIELIKELDEEKRRIQDRLIWYAEEKIDKKIKSSGLERNKRSPFPEILEALKKGNFAIIVDKFPESVPVNKPGNKREGENIIYNEILEAWEEFRNLASQYVLLYSKTYFFPVVQALHHFQETLEKIKIEEDKVFIDDVNKKICEYISSDLVPEIYFRLGERIYHFFIDEFQDTSPIQWYNLLPLIENSLSQGGSLFIVGDTKQAIYRFRGADYRIMKELEKSYFRSIPESRHILKELKINRRSNEKIIEFNRRIFKEAIRNYPELYNGAILSGLTEWEQGVPKEKEGKGHVRVMLIEKGTDEDFALKESVLEIIRMLRERNWNYGKIGILASKNETVMDVSTWLNENSIPFISLSSLDIRKRKITAEVFSLLRFLDSPVDDISFAEFILGDMCRACFNAMISSSDWNYIARQFILKHRKIRRYEEVSKPLYKAFEEEFSEIWNIYFSDLFRLTGYLPLYDLITEIFNTFKVFEKHPHEEATLARILEVVKILEGKGLGGIKDFLSLAEGAGDDETIWELSIPQDIDAIQVMTVHKAKGLEFPVVVMIFDPSLGYDNIFLRDREKGIELLKLTKKLSENNEELKRIYNEKEMDDIADLLNRLYVAFTRAKEELYVVGWKNSSSRVIREKLASLISIEEFGQSSIPVAAVEPCETKEKRGLKFIHHIGSLKFPASSERINIFEVERGEFIHRILSTIKCIFDGIDEEVIKTIEKLNSELGGIYDVKEIVDTIFDTINNPALKELFLQKPGRIIRNEYELTDKYGNLNRMDRVIIDKDIVTVVDYKTGDASSEDEYVEQVRNYMSILSEIYSSLSVKGLIYYVDLRKVRWIE